MVPPLKVAVCVFAIVPSSGYTVSAVAPAAAAVFTRATWALVPPEKSRNVPAGIGPDSACTVIEVSPALTLASFRVTVTGA